MKISAYVPDLMDRSRFPSDLEVTFLRTIDDVLTTNAELVVVDLSRPGVAEAASERARTGTRVVGFASHIDREALAQAKAGSVEAMPRSRFFSHLREILAAENHGE